MVFQHWKIQGKLRSWIGLLALENPDRNCEKVTMQTLRKNRNILEFSVQENTVKTGSFLGWNTLQKIMGMQWISLPLWGPRKPWEIKGWNTIFQVRQIRRKIYWYNSVIFFQILPDSSRFCHILPYSCRFFHILSDSSIFFQILPYSFRFFHILSDSSRFFQIVFLKGFELLVFSIFYQGSHL